MVEPQDSRRDVDTVGSLPYSTGSVVGFCGHAFFFQKEPVLPVLEGHDPSVRKKAGSESSLRSARFKRSYDKKMDKERKRELALTGVGITKRCSDGPRAHDPDGGPELQC